MHDQRRIVRRKFALVRVRIRRVGLLLQFLPPHILSDFIMSELSDTQTALNDLQETVNQYEAKDAELLATLTQTIKDLEAQLAAGPPGLTAEQGQALRAQIAAIKAKVQEPIA